MEAGYEAIAEAANAVFIMLGLIILISFTILFIGIVLTIIGYVKKNKALNITGIVMIIIGSIPIIFIVGKLVINAMMYYL